MYLNPSSDHIRAEYRLPLPTDNATINLTHITGKVLRAVSINNPGKEGNVIIDLQDLSSDIYIVNIKTDGYIETRKLVVNK